MGKRILIGLSLALNLVVLASALGLHLASDHLYMTRIRPILVRARTTFFEAYPIQPGDVVMLGDSITEGAEWAEVLPNHPVRNRGIGGDRTIHLLERLDPISTSEAGSLFLKIGTNDLGADVPHDEIVSNYAAMLDRIAREAPTTRVVVQSVLPRDASYRERIERLNEAIRALAAERQLIWLDLYPHFLAGDGSLRDELTYDELHLNGAGYRVWGELLRPHLPTH